MMYKYAYGNHLDTLTYAWRIPENEEVDPTVVSRIFSCQNDQQSTSIYTRNATGFHGQIPAFGEDTYNCSTEYSLYAIE